MYFDLNNHIRGYFHFENRRAFIFISSQLLEFFDREDTYVYSCGEKLTAVWGSSCRVNLVNFPDARSFRSKTLVSYCLFDTIPRQHIEETVRIVTEDVRSKLQKYFDDQATAPSVKNTPPVIF